MFAIVALRSQASSEAMTIAPHFEIIDRFFIITYGPVFYLFNLFVPIGLSAIHFYPDNTKALPLIFYSGPLVIALIGLLIWKAKAFRKELIFGLLVFIMAISPVLQLIPVGQAYAAERYSYIPYVGLFFIIGQFYARVTENKFRFAQGIKTPVKYILWIAILVFSFLTFQRVKVWSDSIVLYNDVIEKYPESSTALWLRANVNQEYGQDEAALFDYNKAIELNPNYAKAYFNRGVLKAKQNKFDDAIVDYNRSIEIDPKYGMAFYMRGNAYSDIKKYDSALQDYLVVLNLDPKEKLGYRGCGRSYLGLQNNQKAIEYYLKAVELDQTDGDTYHNLGVAYYNDNQKSKACESWNHAGALNFKLSKDMLRDYCK